MSVLAHTFYHYSGMNKHVYFDTPDDTLMSQNIEQYITTYWKITQI